jgi:hypothetical protein
MLTRQKQTNPVPQSQVVVTFACGHGERVPAGQLAEIRAQIRAGARCSRCNAERSSTPPSS